jgi:ribosome biogenesis GTPase / thiamine phosphate phosphatase
VTITTPETTKLLATVVAVQANFYRVRLDNSGDLLLCTRRTRLKKIGQKVMVGDRVLVEEVDLTAESGAIAEVLPRKTELNRPPVANADQILLVFAVEDPLLDPWQLSRFLVKAESTELNLCLCLNKTDLITQDTKSQWQKTLKKWGYEPFFVSVNTGDGMPCLKGYLREKITIVVGPSGVGKSSLINALVPDLQLRTGTVSGKLHRGRHTTRHVELFELPDGGLLADSPGFNQPDLDLEPTNLAFCFPEIRAKLAEGNCKFNDCFHRDEPGCVVRGDWERYELYLAFLDEAIARQEALQKTPDQDSSLKIMVKNEGKKQFEPRLESKKYRRSSRRERHQNLSNLYDNLDH